MNRPVTMAEAQLPLSLNTFADGSLSLIDARGYFILSLSGEDLREIVEKLTAALAPPEWPGQPIPKGPA